MKRVSFLSGRIYCRECRSSWPATWNVSAASLICGDCGGQCIPEGPQTPTTLLPSAIDGEMYRLEMLARRSVMS